MIGLCQSISLHIVSADPQKGLEIGSDEPWFEIGSNDYYIMSHNAIGHMGVPTQPSGKDRNVIVSTGNR